MITPKSFKAMSKRKKVERKKVRVLLNKENEKVKTLPYLKGKKEVFVTEEKAKILIDKGFGKKDK